MRIVPAAAVPIVLLLLTWLSLRALNPGAELFDQALGALDRFAMVESALHRDLLSARSGMLRNYDPLVQEVNALDASLARLHETAAVDSETATTIDRLASSVARQQDLIEQFKSQNALLQNSLAYVGLFITRLGAADPSGPIVPTLSRLAASMLHLTLDTSATAVQDAENWLDALASQPPPPGAEAAVGGLLAHGRLLHKLLPATDSVLKVLYALPHKQDQESLRAMVLTRQMASRTTARRFRLLLYITSLALVGVLTRFGWQLRARARALERRAAFEHMIAGISTRFIDAKPHTIGVHIEQALTELAEYIGADRAYFVLSGAETQLHTWSRKGIEYPAGWPDRALELATGLVRTGDGTIFVSSVADLAAGADKDTLVAAGLHGWICILGLGGCASGTLLGFDALRPWHATKTCGFGLLRMGHNAITNAVRRELLEREKAYLEQHLQQTRRMETVGALACGIAHNFNNIIGAILGYAEMTETQVSPDGRPARNLGAIRRAGERARDLVDQILTFGRRQDVRRRQVAVQDLVAESASLLEASLPPGITPAIHDASGSAVLFGDHTQLQQVILNLCNNAAQAIDGTGGRIELDVTVQEIAHERTLIHGDLIPGRYVRIAVIDDGRGMDEATLRRIFEPFFTTRMAGNGLGLATVLEIVREHDGAMNVRSTPGAGSCFEVWLPCIAVPASRSSGDFPPLPLGRGETVLAVDAEREQLLRAEDLLAALGYEPVGFARADDALAACAEEPKRFDMVVSHLVPAASTLKLAAALHDLASDLPILLATASADGISTELLVATGVVDVVHWPIVANQMAAALERCSAMKRN